MITSIVAAIYLLCDIRVVAVDKYTKIQCIEYYTNCLVGPNGRFMEEKISSCKKEYKNEQN